MTCFEERWPHDYILYLHSQGMLRRVEILAEVARVDARRRRRDEEDADRAFRRAVYDEKPKVDLAGGPGHYWNQGQDS